MSNYLLGPRFTAGEVDRGAFVYALCHHDIWLGVTRTPLAHLARQQVGRRHPLRYVLLAKLRSRADEIVARARRTLTPYRLADGWFSVPEPLAAGAIREAAIHFDEPLVETTPVELASLPFNRH